MENVFIEDLHSFALVGPNKNDVIPGMYFLLFKSPFFYLFSTNLIQFRETNLTEYHRYGGDIVSFHDRITAIGVLSSVTEVLNGTNWDSSIIPPVPNPSVSSRDGHRVIQVTRFFWKLPGTRDPGKYSRLPEKTPGGAGKTCSSENPGRVFPGKMSPRG